jgi:hypothetical protein
MAGSFSDLHWFHIGPWLKYNQHDFGKHRNGSDLHMLRDVDSDIPVFTRPIDRPREQMWLNAGRLLLLRMGEWLV